MWTSLAADAGVTAPVGSDAACGVITMSTAATNNNEVAVISTNEVFKFAANGAFIFESVIKYAEANTDDANVAVGLADAASANLLLDDGAGSGINSSGVLIYKVDGGTVWKCVATNNSVTRSSTAAQTAGGSSYQRLTIVGVPTGSGVASYDITYFLDGQHLTDSTTNKPIQHRLAYASSTEMKIVAGYIKAGGATNETLLIDRTYFGAYRA